MVLTGKWLNKHPIIANLPLVTQYGYSQINGFENHRSRMHVFSHQVMEKFVENSRQKKSYKVCEKARKTSLTRYAIALFQVSIEGLIRCNQIASIQSKTEDTISNHVRDDKRDVFCWKCHLGHRSAMDQWVRKIAAPFLSIFPKQIRSSSFH